MKIENIAGFSLFFAWVFAVMLIYQLYHEPWWPNQITFGCDSGYKMFVTIDEYGNDGIYGNGIDVNMVCKYK